MGNKLCPCLKADGEEADQRGFTDVHGRMNDNDCDGRDGGSSGIDSAVGMHGYNTTNNDNGDHDNLNDGEASHHSHNDYSTGGGDAVSEERPIAQRIRRKSIIDHLKAWAFRGKEKAQKAAKGGANDTTDTDNDNDDDDETDSHSSCTSARFERKRADSDSSGYDHDDYRPRSRSRDHRKPGPLDRKRSLNSIVEGDRDSDRDNDEWADSFRRSSHHRNAGEELRREHAERRRQIGRHKQHTAGGELSPRKGGEGSRHNNDSHNDYDCTDDYNNGASASLFSPTFSAPFSPEEYQQMINPMITTPVWTEYTTKTDDGGSPLSPDVEDRLELLEKNIKGVMTDMISTINHTQAQTHATRFQHMKIMDFIHQQSSLQNELKQGFDHMLRRLIGIQKGIDVDSLNKKHEELNTKLDTMLAAQESNAVLFEKMIGKLHQFQGDQAYIRLDQNNIAQVLTNIQKNTDNMYTEMTTMEDRMAQQMREQMNEQSEILELLQLVVEQLNNQASITTMIFPKAAGMNGTTLTSLAPSSRSSSSSSSQNKSSKMMFKSSSASSFPTLAEALTSGSPRSTGGRNDSIDYSKSEFIDEVVASKFDVGSPPAYLQPGFKPPLRRMFSKGKLKRSASDKDTRDHGQKRSSAMNRRASAAQLADAESFMSSMRKSTIGGHDSSHSSSGGEPAPMSRSVTIDPTFSGMVGRNKGRGSGKKKARKETQSQLQRVKSLKTTADKLRRLQTLKMREKENIQKEKHPHAQTQSLHHTHERRDLQKENSVSSNIGMVLHAQGREMGSLTLSQGQAALSNWNTSVSAARAVKKLKKRSRKKEGKNKKHGNNSSRSASRNISRTSSRTLSRAPSKMV